MENSAEGVPEQNDHQIALHPTAHPHLKANHALTDEEKSERRGLKRLLARQKRRKKLETRLQQAINRKDLATEEFSRKELKQFLDEEDNELWKTHSWLAPTDSLFLEFQNKDCPPAELTTSHRTEAKARDGIESLYQRYYRKLQERQRQEQESNRAGQNHCNSAVDDLELDAMTLKEKQTAEARLLLRNMTRGTQQLHMFENQSALMGYVRQKFQERATLSISSLSKLDPRRFLPRQTLDDRNKQGRFWNQLLKVRSICSIGCGPGCDAVGNIKFLEHFAAAERETSQTTTTIIDRVVFLDWTMDKWQYFLLPLVDGVLIPGKCIVTAHIAFADVLKPLSDASNELAKRLVTSTGSENNNPEGNYCSIDLFVTSYLLTETRGKWHDFYKETIATAKPGALFLHAEPTAWQLLTLIDLSSHLMDFVWLDSSFGEPVLQALEGRAGPAVLLGMKRHK